MLKKIFGVIYKATDPRGHCYIGQHVGDGSDVGKTYFGSGTYFKYTRKKHGKKYFTYSIIEKCYSLEQLNSMEIYYIKFFQAREYQNGYNLTDGGDGCSGYKFTEEFKLNQSKSAKIAQNNPETKKKIADSKNNRSEEEKKDTSIKLSISKTATWQNKSEQQKALIKKKELETKANRSEEEKEISRNKQSETIANKSDEEKAKISKKQSNSAKIAQNRPETKQIKRNNTKRQWETPESRDKLIAGMKIAANKPEVINKRLETIANKSDEEKAESLKRRIEAGKYAWINKSDEEKEIISNKLSAIQTVINSDPVVRKKKSISGKIAQNTTKAKKRQRHTAHTRWHHNRNIINLNCDFCREEENEFNGC